MTPESLEKHVSVLMERVDKKPFIANELINEYIAKHKHFSAEDKKILLDLVWRVIRAMGRLKYAYTNYSWQDRVHCFISNGLPNLELAPNFIQWEVPEWFVTHVPDAAQELSALLANPSIVLRVIGDRNDVQHRLATEGINTIPTTLSPYG